MGGTVAIEEIKLDYRPLTDAMSRRKATYRDLAEAARAPITKVLEIIQYAHKQEEGSADSLPCPSIALSQYVRLADYLGVPLSAMTVGGNCNE